MDKLRRFRINYKKSSDAVGIGIVEHLEKWNTETIAIQSLYVKGSISNRDIYVSIMQRIYNDLADGELAIVQMTKHNDRKRWDEPYKNRIKVQHVGTVRGQMYHANLLVNDALKRQTDITEQFDEAIKFSAIQIEKEERKNNN